MGIKIFLFVIFIVIGFYIKLNSNIKIEKKIVSNKANVVFFDSIMYDINDNKIAKIIQSKIAKNYDSFDELYDASIISSQDRGFDTISARYILKKKYIYKLFDDVYLNRSDGLNLSSNYLEFDDNNKILTNNTEFVINYKNSITYGENLFFDLTKEILQANNIESKIKGL